MLIKCEECGGQVSSEAKSCPHCGYVLSKTKKEKPKTKKEKQSNSNKTLTNLLKFEWIDDVGDWLSDIPVIGGCLTVLFALLIFGLIAAAGILALVGIFSVSYRLGTILLAVGMAVVSYLASYKWHNRNKLFFLMGLAGAIILFIVSFFVE